MKPLSFTEFLDYLAGLGQRHRDINTSVATLASEYKAPAAAGFPLCLVESDPMIEGLTPALDQYQVAIQFLCCAERTDATGNPDLVMQAKRLADQYCEQLRWEQRVQFDGLPSFLPMYGTGTSRLASGVRVEMRLKVVKPLIPANNPGLFADPAGFPYTLPLSF